MKYFVIFILLAHLGAFSSKINAKQSEITQNYKVLLSKGHEYFQEKNYQEALTVYLQSFAIEPLDSTLNNIAICHFKLQQWPDALTRFEELNGNQQGVALLEYYIAVTHKKLGNMEQAIDVFYNLVEQEEDDSVALLAAKQLQKITSASDNHSALTKKDASIWRGMIDTQLGYDSNVSLPFDDELALAKETSDQYLNFLANTSWVSSNDFTNAWVIDATYFSSTYKEATDYDISLLSFNGRKYFNSDAWKKTTFYFGLAYDSITLSGKDYLDNSSASFGMSYKISVKQKLLIALTLKKVSEGSSDYAYLAGTSNKLKIAWRQNVTNGYWKAGVIFEQDDRNDKYNYIITDEGTQSKEIDDFTSYSTDRFSLFASKVWQYNKWEFSVNAKYRYSIYDTANIASGYRLGIREDERMITVVGSTYNITDELAATAEVDWSKNISNFSAYEYNQYTTALGLTWVF